MRYTATERAWQNAKGSGSSASAPDTEAGPASATWPSLLLGSPPAEAPLLLAEVTAPAVLLKRATMASGSPTIGRLSAARMPAWRAMDDPVVALSPTEVRGGSGQAMGSMPRLALSAAVMWCYDQHTRLAAMAACMQAKLLHGPLSVHRLGADWFGCQLSLPDGRRHLCGHKLMKSASCAARQFRCAQPCQRPQQDTASVALLQLHRDVVTPAHLSAWEQ